MVNKYMSKSICVEVLLHKDESRDLVFGFTNGQAEYIIPMHTKKMELYIHTETGPKKTNIGDYIVKNDNKILSVLSPKEFEKQFIKVEE